MQASVGPSHVLRGSTHAVQCICFDPEERFLLSGDQDGTLNVWNLRTRRVVARQRSVGAELQTTWTKEGRLTEERSSRSSACGSKEGLIGAAFTSNRSIISQGREGTIRLWHLSPDGTLVGEGSTSIAGGLGFCRLAVSGGIPSGLVALPGHDNGEINVWDLESQTKVCAIRGGVASPSTAVGQQCSGGAGMCMSIHLLQSEAASKGSPCSVLGAFEDGSVQVWDVRNASSPIFHKIIFEDAILASDYDPKRGIFAFGDANGKVVLSKWNVQEISLSDELKLDVDSKGIADIAIQSKRKLVAIGSWAGKVHLYDLKHPRRLFSSDYHNDGVTSTCFSPDGKILASSSKDRTIGLWSI